MPFADFAALPFFVSLLVPITRGNVVRMLILGTFGAIAGLYMATWMAPIQTEAAVQVASQVVPEGGGLIANMGDGWVTTAWALFVPAETWGPVAGVAWTLIFIAVVWILGFMFNRNPGKWSVLAGTVPSSSDEETRR